MRCSRADRLIERYLDGRLPEGLAAEIGEHLGQCERCAARLATARVVEDALRAPDVVRAPAALRSGIMEAVYREDVVRRGQTGRGQTGRARGAAPGYRRLGYSFVATAAVLAASLLVPRLAYPNLLQKELLAASLGAGKPAAVARIVQDAGLGLGTVLTGASKAQDR